tara:strand:+ start:14513 stop:15259 length:747 start_codon:yes stop_codon:yes gene_type:complete
MAFNQLSGTIIAPEYFGPSPGSGLNNVIVGTVSGTLQGNAADIEGVPRIVANATENNLLTVGVDADSLVGEPTLTFDGVRLNISGQLTASSAISASVFYGSAAGLTDLPAANGGGPSGAIQFMTNAGSISGSGGFLFQNNNLKIDGGVIGRRRNIASNVQGATASVSDYIIGVDTTATSTGIRLQRAITLENGQMLVIKDEGGSANINNITINASGSDKIDGQSSVILQSPYASIQLFCNGSGSYFIY